MPKRWDQWGMTKASEKAGGGLLFHNNRYHCILRILRNRVEDAPGILHLSIRNNNRTADRDWRDYQRIKNELVGPEYEMVEMYPKESNLVDSSNQFHLWGFEDHPDAFSNIGLGWTDGRFVWDGVSPKPAVKDAEKAVQRPMEYAEASKTLRLWFAMAKQLTVDDE
jgi:hypothetical protein